MKIWILLLIAGLLLVWSFSREGFEPTETIKAPPYDAEEVTRIVNMLSAEDRGWLKQTFKEGDNAMDDAGAEIFLQMAVQDAVGRAYNKLYKPASSPITEEQIDQHVTAMPIPPGKERFHEIFKRLLKKYFIDQAPALPPSTTQGSTAGGTTGGSSTNSPAPNAGPVANSGKGQPVYGPVFTSLGTPISGSGEGDSSKTNQYPELLGGVGDTTSVRSSAGIQGPSQNWLLMQSGALPSTASLGSDANSGYFPYSRVPGDQDLIPDPYRLARNYSTASYSSKTDPVPFLTDFSAFQK